MRKIIPSIILASLLLFFIAYLIQQPSTDKNWNQDQKVTSSFKIENNLAHVSNIRNISYRSTEDYDVHYYDKTFDLDNIASIDYAVVPIADWRGPAHTQLSFGFDTEDGSREYVAISVEIRKEVEEEFSPLKGLLRKFELMYVVADEEDVIKLRTNYRENNVYLYPIKTTQENMKQMFISMLERVNKLNTEPEFYNTFFNSCTTNIADHINIITPNRVPFNYKVAFPGYSDELAYDLGLIDTNFKLEELREKYNISEAARNLAEHEDFSIEIRKAIQTY